MMFGWFSDGPRTWKWAVPGFIAMTLGFWGVLLVGSLDAGEMTHNIGIFMVILAMFAFGIGFSHYLWWVKDHNADVNMKMKEADAITPRGYMLHEAKGVHPDVLRMILGEQARRWGIVSGSKSPTGEPYSVLMSRPRVTEAFVVYFLRMSNEQTYMPKRLLSDNDHSFDPQKQVTAYEMYDDLESLLVEEMKATRPMGSNKPGYWLGEWGPHSVGKDYGVDIEEWDVEESSTSQGAGLRSNGSGSSSSLIEKALEGLEQTEQMKRRTAGALGK